MANWMNERLVPSKPNFPRSAGTLGSRGAQTLLEHARLFAARRGLVAIHLANVGTTFHHSTRADCVERSGIALGEEICPQTAEALAHADGLVAGDPGGRLGRVLKHRSYWLHKRPALPADVDAALIQDLRLFENKRLYDRVDDINFLRSLEVSGLFKDEF